MSKEKMEKVLYDMQVAQAVLEIRRNDFSTDRDKEALFESVYRKHKIDREVFDSSLVWYAVNDMDLLLKINDSVTAGLRKQYNIFDELNKEESELNEKRREDRILVPFIYLTNDRPVYSFNIDSVNVASVNLNTITKLHFKTLGIKPDISFTASARLEYADTIIVNEYMVNDTAYFLTVPRLVNDSLKNISGFMRVGSMLPRFSMLLFDIGYEQDTTRTSTILHKDTVQAATVMEPLSIKEN